FRSNPDLDTEAVITELAVGEALVSVLDGKGVPTEVERILIRPPASQMGPITNEERFVLLKGSVLAGVFDQALGRESAYEILRAQADQALAEDRQSQPEASRKKRPQSEKSVV